VVCSIEGDKVQTSLWLDRDVKRLIEDEGVNLSQWVNKNILVSLSVDSEKDILAKIAEHESSIKVLKSRLESLKSVKKGVSDDRKLCEVALGELQHTFVYRRNNGVVEELDRDWILSPRNIGRCKLLKKEPSVVLFELREWYDGLQSNQK